MFEPRTLKWEKYMHKNNSKVKPFKHYGILPEKKSIAEFAAYACFYQRQDGQRFKKKKSTCPAPNPSPSRVTPLSSHLALFAQTRYEN